MEVGDTDKTLFILAGHSTAAIAISRKKGINKRNRHIEVRAMWLQHLIRTPGVSLQKVLGKRNWSDVLTKVDDWSMDHLYYLGIQDVPLSEAQKEVGVVRTSTVASLQDPISPSEKQVTPTREIQERKPRQTLMRTPTVSRNVPVGPGQMSPDHRSTATTTTTSRKLTPPTRKSTRSTWNRTSKGPTGDGYSGGCWAWWSVPWRSCWTRSWNYWWYNSFQVSVLCQVCTVLSSFVRLVSEWFECCLCIVVSAIFTWQ